MRHRITVIAAVGIVVSALGVTAADATPAGRQAPGDDRLDVYVGTLDLRQLETLRASGIDPHDIAAMPKAGGQLQVEVVVSGEQADELADQGVDLELKQVNGESAAEMSTRLAAAGYAVFRPYSGPGGLKEEFEQIAADASRHRQAGRHRQDGARPGHHRPQGHPERPQDTDGSRPATLFSAAQHAREWITPEMVRRLIHYVVDSYGTNPDDHAASSKNTELWFVPVANPDGYDCTFQPDQRLWRKNLRDNDGDGVITPVDGVDPNRNYPTKWGYDNEGSSPDPASETYRGPAPSSEPETRALDGLMRRVGFEFLINYHSAAELLLYGTGWQVATPTPDDAIYEAMVGDDANPAVPGYDPDISAELYTTNGETTEHAAQQVRHAGVHARDVDVRDGERRPIPNDQWDPADCASVFNFPDDEELIQAEFEKNIPFALATAKSAADPDDPVSVVGRDAPDFVVDSFAVSYGDPQPVAVVARRAPVGSGGCNYQHQRRPDTPHRRCPSGTAANATATRRRLLRRVPRQGPGRRARRQVEVWFSARRAEAWRRRERAFTYTVAADTGADVLIIANEDYTGRQPDLPGRDDAPKYADDYAAALDANGISHDTLRRRRPGRASPPRRARPLRRRRLGARRQPPRPGSGGRDHRHVPVRAAARPGGGRTAAVPDDRRPRLPQRGRQAASTPARPRGTSACSADSIGGIYYGLDGRPKRTASSPRTSSATACCWPTTSCSTTSARSPGRRSRTRAASSEPARRSRERPPTSAGQRSSTTRSTRRARSR